jgi:RHS repeat-associated protein
MPKARPRWAPGGDNDGNMTTRVDSIGFSTTGYVADTFAYDAWDRLASMTHTIPNGGGVSWTETDFDIDALGRRDQVVVTENACTPVPSDNLFYSIDWQVLEDDRATSVNNGVATGWTRNQYVWSPTYVNDLVLRDKDTNHDNTFVERLYVEQDANHNVTAITDTSGNVKERFVYDPYGAQTVLNSSWSSTGDTYTWIYGFQGGRYDSYAGLYNFQRREYDPTLGRWMQQDPAGYVDGKNLYQYVDGNPVASTDSFGLQAGPPTRPSPPGGMKPTPPPVVRPSPPDPLRPVDLPVGPPLPVVQVQQPGKSGLTRLRDNFYIKVACGESVEFRVIAAGRSKNDPDELFHDQHGQLQSLRDYLIDIEDEQGEETKVGDQIWDAKFDLEQRKTRDPNARKNVTGYDGVNYSITGRKVGKGRLTIRIVAPTNQPATNPTTQAGPTTQPTPPAIEDYPDVVHVMVSVTPAK